MRAAAAVLLFAGMPAAFGSAVEEKRLFCTREEQDWTVQSFAPLIDLRKSPVFVSAKYSGVWLSSVIVHQYNERRELAAEYTFDQAGRLEMTIGHLRRWGRWTATANLYRDEAGKATAPRVTYLIHGGETTYSAPEGAEEFKNVLTSVPMYRTLDAVPCGVQLAEQVASHGKSAASR